MTAPRHAVTLTETGKDENDAAKKMMLKFWVKHFSHRGVLGVVECKPFSSMLWHMKNVSEYHFCPGLRDIAGLDNEKMIETGNRRAYARRVFTLSLIIRRAQLQISFS